MFEIDWDKMTRGNLDEYYDQEFIVVWLLLIDKCVLGQVGNMSTFSWTDLESGS